MFLMAFRIIPVVQFSGGMLLLILFVAGHSLNRCHGVWSSIKHKLQIGLLWISDYKRVKQEVKGTLILPPLVFPA